MPEVKTKIILEVEGKEKAEEVMGMIKGLGKDVKILSTTTEKTAKDMGHSLTFIAWHFRYLGSIFAKIHSQWLRMVKDFVKTSAELQESFLSIEVAAALYGQDAERATRFTKELALTGLIPLTEAANSVKNLMITGIGLPEMEKFTYRYLDVAFLFTSGIDEMQKSLEIMSESILRGTLVLSKDVTARTLWDDTNKRLQRTMGVTLKDLSAQRKAMEILTTIETKYAATQGLHQMEMETTRAAMTRLTTSITLIKEAFGIALIPIVDLLSKTLAKLTGYITGLIETFGPLISTVTAAGLVITFFMSKIAFGLGILLSFVKIAYGTAAAVWKLYLPFIAVSAVLTAGVYLFLKYTGALDKARVSAKSISDQLNKLKETFAGVMSSQEESIEVDEEKRISHERAVADIMEDLERERSKGLWANQMSIKDLEKRLARENEDWNLYLKKKGTTEERGGTKSMGIFDEILGKSNEVVEEMKTSWEGLWSTIAESFKKIDWKKLWTDVWSEFLSWPPIVQGAVAGLGTYMALTLPVLAWKGIAKVLSHWTLLFTTVSAPLTITIFVAAAVTAIGLILNELKKLGNAIDAVEDMFSRNQETASKYLKMLKKNYEDGKISLDEWHQKLKKFSEDQEALRVATTEAILPKGWLWTFSEFIAKTPLGWYAENLQKFWRTLMLQGRIPTMEELKGMPFQFGGIVPGMRNQPVPILAHGGERVIPAGEVGGGGGEWTININANVRNSQDIKEIARAVSQIMGQRARFGRMGAT